MNPLLENSIVKYKNRHVCRHLLLGHEVGVRWQTGKKIEKWKMLSEYGVVDHTEVLEEIQKEIESDESEDELTGRCGEDRRA